MDVWILVQRKWKVLEIVIPKFLPVHENFPVKPEVLLGIIEFETTKPRKRAPLKKKNSTLSVLSTDADAGPIAVTTIKHSFQIEMNDIAQFEDYHLTSKLSQSR
jgi:hypothetical protein